MKILLYVYLGISILTSVLYCLKSVILKNRILAEYGEELKELNLYKDIFNVVFAYAKLIIVSFIPIINVIFLFAILFTGDNFDKKTIEKVLNGYGLESN